VLFEDGVVTILDAAVDQEVANGGRLESRTSDHAVFRYGAGNVLLHITFAALTLVVSGLFVFPWIVWANTIREHRVTLRADPDRGIVRSR
jgi:hypothetical protein